MLAHGADTEEGAVRQARQEAEQHHRVEVGRKGRQRVKRGKHQHEPDQHAARRAVAEHADQGRRTDDHADGVGRNQVTRLGNRNIQAGGDVGQDAHHDEFRHADAKTAQGQWGQALLDHYYYL
jgi:hypothetical protein